MVKKLNSAVNLEKLQADYFVRMMLPNAEEKAVRYSTEEKIALLSVLENKIYNSYNFVVIGSGTLWYIDEVYEKVHKYIAVEPLAEIFIHKQVMFLIDKLSKVLVINDEFGNFSEKLINDFNNVLVFHFNILSYIPDPIQKINKYLKEGDVIFISSWSSTSEAKNIRKAYFDFINNGISDDDLKIDPSSDIGLCDLDLFDFLKLSHYKSHKRIKGEITDILIIFS